MADASQVVIKPMDEHFILWRCLHDGPLAAENLEPPLGDARAPWGIVRPRNLALLRKLIAVYGSCAMLAWDGDRVVGSLRYYPQVIAAQQDGMMCLQQLYPAGPSERLIEQPFPPLGAIADKTLLVHCLMTGCPSRPENPYQRRGIGSRLARALVAWAQERGWRAIEATAYQDLDILYRVTGQAGVRFWEKLGFAQVAVGLEAALSDDSPFARAVRERAAAQGMSAEAAAFKYIMRLEWA